VLPRFHLFTLEGAWRRSMMIDADEMQQARGLP